MRERRIEVVPRVNARPQQFSLRRAGFLRAPAHGRGSHGDQTGAVGGILWHHAGGGHPLPPPRHGRERLRAWRAFGGRVADGFCLRHVLLLGGHLRRLRGPVRLALRRGLHVDRSGQRLSGLAACLGGAWPPHAADEPASGQRHHAGVLRQALRLQRAEDRRFDHRLYLPHPLHGLALQRPFPAVRHGLQHRLHALHHPHGGADLRLCGGGRLHGHGHQRFHSGAHHAGRHRRGGAGGTQ